MSQVTQQFNDLYCLSRSLPTFCARRRVSTDGFRTTSARATAVPPPVTGSPRKDWWMSRDGRRRRALTLVGMALPLVTAAAITIPSSSANAADGRKPVAGTKPAWAKDATRAATTMADSTQQIDARVWLT